MWCSNIPVLKVWDRQVDDATVEAKVMQVEWYLESSRKEHRLIDRNVEAVSVWEMNVWITSDIIALCQMLRSTLFDIILDVRIRVYGFMAIRNQYANKV